MRETKTIRTSVIEFPKQIYLRSLRAIFLSLFLSIDLSGCVWGVMNSLDPAPLKDAHAYKDGKAFTIMTGGTLFVPTYFVGTARSWGPRRGIFNGGNLVDLTLTAVPRDGKALRKATVKSVTSSSPDIVNAKFHTNELGEDGVLLRADSPGETEVNFLLKISESTSSPNEVSGHWKVFSKPASSVSTKISCEGFPIEGRSLNQIVLEEGRTFSLSLQFLASDGVTLTTQNYPKQVRFEGARTVNIDSRLIDVDSKFDVKLEALSSVGHVVLSSSLSHDPFSVDVVKSNELQNTLFVLENQQSFQMQPSGTVVEYSRYSTVVTPNILLLLVRAKDSKVSCSSYGDSNEVISIKSYSPNVCDNAKKISRGSLVYINAFQDGLCQLGISTKLHPEESKFQFLLRQKLNR